MHINHVHFACRLHKTKRNNRHFRSIVHFAKVNIKIVATGKDNKRFFHQKRLILNGLTNESKIQFRNVSFSDSFSNSNMDIISSRSLKTTHICAQRLVLREAWYALRTVLHSMPFTPQLWVSLASRTPNLRLKIILKKAPKQERRHTSVGRKQKAQ